MITAGRNYVIYYVINNVISYVNNYRFSIH